MNLLTSSAGRKALFACLYLSEGAPIGFIWWAMPAKLRSGGMPVEQITALTALLVLPWSFKFLWAPMVDALRGRLWGFRAWIITAQMLMGLTLIPLFFLPISDHLNWVAPLLVLHAFLAATQDVSIDALAINTVPAEERGAVNGFMQLGMLGGRAAFGGGLLYFERSIGEQNVYLLLLGCIWFSMLILLFLTRNVMDQYGIATIRQRLVTFACTLWATVSKPVIWIGFSIALTAGAGFEVVGGVASVMFADLGFSKEQTGAFFFLPVVICMGAGSMMGGVVADHVPRVFAVTASIVLTAAAVAVLASVMNIATLVGLFFALGAVYLCIGVMTASTYALFMDLTDPRLGATQFSAFMGATNLCEAWAVFVGGKLIVSVGYSFTFVVMAGVSMIAIPLVLLLRKVRGASSPAPADKPRE